MKVQYGAIVLLFAGLLTLAASFAYPHFFGGASQWSEADAEEYTLAARKFHSESLQPRGSQPLDSSGAPSPEFLRAQDKFLQMKQRLDEARNAGKGIARGLFIAGVTLTVVGGLAFFAMRSDPE